MHFRVLHMGRARRRRGAGELVPRRAAAEDRATQAEINEERLWRLLEHGSVTLKELREHGVKAPAQGLYDLRLAGYVIDRLRVPDEAGQPTLAYRLNSISKTLPDQPSAPELPGDPHSGIPFAGYRD